MAEGVGFELTQNSVAVPNGFSDQRNLVYGNIYATGIDFGLPLDRTSILPLSRSNHRAADRAITRDASPWDQHNPVRVSPVPPVQLASCLLIAATGAFIGPTVHARRLCWEIIRA